MLGEETTASCCTAIVPPFVSSHATIQSIPSHFPDESRGLEYMCREEDADLLSDGVSFLTRSGQSVLVTGRSSSCVQRCGIAWGLTGSHGGGGLGMGVFERNTAGVKEACEVDWRGG